MSRAVFTFLLVSIAVPLASLRATEPGKPELTLSGSGTLTLTGSNSYSGGTTLSVGTLQVQPQNPGATNTNQGTLTLTGGNTYSGGTTVNGALLGSWGVEADGVNFTASSSALYLSGIGSVSGNAARTPTTPIPNGPVFYVITQGAGLGDSVHSVPCTGKETVMDAVGHVNGISQLSGTKIWIARPMPGSRDKSTILPVDWEAISKRGINTTNYTFLPGDRLVFGEDPLITRSNSIAKKTAPIERIDGVVSLTSSVLSGLNGLPAGDCQVLKEFVQKGLFTDDEEFKQVMLDAIRVSEQEKKKAGAKAGTEQKPGKEEKPSAAGPKATVTFTNSGSTVSTTFSGVIQNGANPTLTINGLVLTVNGSVSSGEAPPHELAMRPLPAYRIESPDVISIEMLKLVPLPPYRAEVYDVFEIRVKTPPDQPINKNYVVQPDGTIGLGPPYGSVRVAGLTTNEMTTTLNKYLGKWLRDPSVTVQLARVAGAQPVTGQYLVGPDGTINLRKYGIVPIAGKTVVEARMAIQKHLRQFLDEPELAVDVVAFNSKVYYIITQGAGMGDNAQRHLPFTGNETVLDAISQINGLSQVSSKNIWIVRPSAAEPEKAKILHVDWDGITGRGATATNYQLYPGDRLYIGEDPLITRTQLISKKTAPIERLMGILSLTSSTLSGLKGVSPADIEVLDELVRKGAFTSDEEFKGILLKAIHAKARAKEVEKGKPGQ